MLSNVKFQKELDLRSLGYSRELIFTFDGHSMLDFSNDEKTANSVFGSNDHSTTEIHCEYACCLEKVLKEVESLKGEFFIAQSFFNDPFMANVKTVGGDWIMFQFHNSDKVNFPDQYLRLDEMKSIHLVTSISYYKGRNQIGNL